MPLPDYIDNSRYKLQTLIKDENQIILDIATGFFRIEAWVRLEAAMNQLISLRYSWDVTPSLDQQKAIAHDYVVSLNSKES